MNGATFELEAGNDSMVGAVKRGAWDSTGRVMSQVSETWNSVFDVWRRWVSVAIAEVA